MDRKMSELALFKLESTLLHPSPVRTACVSAVLDEAGIDVHPCLVDATLGLPTALTLRLLAPDARPELEAMHRELERRLVAAYASSKDSPEVFGATRCLERLQMMDIRVAIDTGFSRPVVDVLLERLGWVARGILDAVVTAEEDAIDTALQMTRVRSALRVARIGKSTFDVLTAAEAGCRVRALVGEASTFEGLPYTHAIPSATLVPELLRRIQQSEARRSMAPVRYENPAFVRSA